MFFESESYRVPEGRGPVTVCVLKDQRVAESFTVHVATTNLTPVQAEGEYSSSYYPSCTLYLLLSVHTSFQYTLYIAF